MTEKLNQANRILDRTCKQANMDPVQVRLAMINALKDKMRIAQCMGVSVQLKHPENGAVRPAGEQ